MSGFFPRALSLGLFSNNIAKPILWKRELSVRHAAVFRLPGLAVPANFQRVSRSVILAGIPSNNSARSCRQIMPDRCTQLVPLLLLTLMLVPAASGSSGQNDITNDWSSTIGAWSDSSPAIGKNGLIYFGAADGRFCALNPDGSFKWVFQAGLEIRSAPAISDEGTIYFGCRDRKLYAVNPDGREKWEFKTGGWVDSSPALATDGSVCFGSWDKHFYVLNPDGTQKWRFRTGGEIVSSPAIGLDDRIYFGSHDRRLYSLAPDGRKVWEFATGGPIVSSPALGPDGAVYFTSVDGFCYALDSNGNLRWRIRTGGVTESSPVIGLNGTIYVGVNKGLWAINADGRKKWDQPCDEVVEASPMALADGSICVVPRCGSLNVRDEAGRYQWHYWVGIYGYAAPAVGRDGTIYVPCHYHEFHAIHARVPLAKTSWPKFRANARNTGNVKTVE